MFCPDCGLHNREGAKFCSTCGFSLKNLPDYKAVPASPRNSSPVSRASKVRQGGKPSPAVKKSVPVRSKGQKTVEQSTLPAQPIPKPAPPQKVKNSSPPQPQAAPAPPQPSAPNPVLAHGSGVSSGLLPVGAMLDNRYRILQHIATGGMGAVYKAEDTRFNTIVAVKEMLDFFQDHEDRKYATQRFREEALLLVKLRHPNIPRVTDNFIQNNRYYLVMDFVEGISTEKIIEENAGKPLSPVRVVSWAVQICDVLYYLHTQTPPIIYRDMKPSNVMIQGDDRVMIVDFGIARHFTPRRPGTMIGTHGYAPPEQYKGNTEPRSDLYAGAATIHQLLTGNDPTQGVPFNFKLLKTYRTDISSELEKVLDKALQNRVEMRYTNANEMKNALMATPEFRRNGGSAGVAASHSVNYQKIQPSVTPPARAAQPQSSSPPPHQASVPPPPSYAAGKSSPNADAQNHFQRAQQYVDKGNYVKAKRELDKSLKQSPDYPEAHVLMGYILTKLNYSREAIKHLDKAVALSPGSATAHLYLGKAYAKLGRIEESEKEYRIASRLDPDLFKKENQSFLEKLIRSLLS